MNEQEMDARNQRADEIMEAMIKGLYNIHNEVLCLRIDLIQQFIERLQNTMIWEDVEKIILSKYGGE